MKVVALALLRFLIDVGKESVCMIGDREEVKILSPIGLLFVVGVV